MVMLKNIGNEIGLDQTAFISGLVEEPNTVTPGVSTVDPNISDENDRCLGHYWIWIILIVGFLYTILSIGILYKMLSANPPQPRRYRVGYRYTNIQK